MLGLKSIWTVKKPADPSPAPAHDALSSISRPVVPVSRADFPAAPPELPSVTVDTRGAERFVPRRTATVLVAESGKKLPARIINVSTLAVAVEADFTQNPIQAIVMVGERRVKPGRKITRGAVFLFQAPLPQHVCGPDLIV